MTPQAGGPDPNLSERPDEPRLDRSRLDSGPILVAVDGRPSGWDALTWAAAEASARNCVLRILTVFSRNFGVETGGSLPVLVGDAGAQANAEVVVNEAANRARAVDSALRITTQVQPGPVSAAVLRTGRHDALIVVGRGRKSRRITALTESPTWQIVRHSLCPVSVITLSGEPAHGPSAGQVVVGLGGTTGPAAALGFACRAALRRGVGVTALHALGPSDPYDISLNADSAAAAEFRALGATLRVLRAAFPEVAIRQRLVPGEAVSALVAESAGAALVVLGSEAKRQPRCLRFQSVGGDVARLAASPVAIVKGD
jgi:nucleotide-binding universal stress UspA family protein